MSGTTPPPSTIKVFLADGPPEGLWLVTKQNWTGVALKFSRNNFKDVRQRAEFSRTGVYVLLGAPAPVDEKREIYIGEATLLRNRLNTHLSQEDFWTEGVVFVAADDFNVSHAKYLEAKLLERAKDSNRATVKNTQPMSGPSLSEAEAADMETFLREMLIVYPILGVTAFESAREASVERLLLSGPDTSAKGQRVDDGFFVFAGATGRQQAVESADAYPKMVALRAELLASGVLKESSGKLELTQDYTFSAPSLAAAVLLGRTANGRTEWKDSDGRTLKQIEETEAASGTGASEPGDS